MVNPRPHRGPGGGLPPPLNAVVALPFTVLNAGFTLVFRVLNLGVSIATVVARQILPRPVMNALIGALGPLGRTCLHPPLSQVSLMSTLLQLTASYT